jgi:hypothetical protein
MLNKKSPFFAFRYLVTPISAQVSLFHTKNKEELMKDIIQNLSENNKTTWTKGNRRYLIYSSQNKNNISIFKYAKETNESIYTEGDDDIEINRIKNTKFVYLIIDTEHQIILMERNTTVFNKIMTSINILSEYLRYEMRKFDYVVNIYPLATKTGFWSFINEADELYELDLLLNAPNMPFLGSSDTREVLEKLKETTNNEEFEIILRNKEGKLKIIKETLGSWIDYVREVGGRFKIKFSKNGVEQTKTSDNDIAKTYIKRKKTEKYTDDELDNIQDKLKAIHKLESRDEEEE